MSSQSEQKEQAIIAILDQLRPFAPTLGSYIKSIYTNDFDFAVKLSNGRIRLPEELVEDFERSPSMINTERCKLLAAKFVPNEPPMIAPSFPNDSIPAVAQKKPSSMSWRTTVIILALLVGGFLWFKSAQKDKTENIARVDIYSQVNVEGSTYMVNRLFGGISDLRITVTNNSDYLVDMVNVKVSYIKASGGLYKDEMLHFNQIAPHSTQTLNAPNSNRGTKVKISQESLTCTALNIY